VISVTSLSRFCYNHLYVMSNSNRVQALRAESKQAVLIVDDGGSIPDSFMNSLNDRFRVFSATDSQGALAILKREKIAVVLVNHKDEIELLQQARQVSPETVGILVIFPDQSQIQNAAEPLTSVQQRYTDLQSMLEMVSSGEVEAWLLSQARQEGVSVSANHTFLDAYTDGFAFVAESGDILYLNPNFADFFGVMPAPGPPWNVSHHEAFTPVKDIYLSTLQVGYTRTNISPVLPKGERRYLEVAATTLPTQAGGRQVVMIVRDQTTHHQSLAHLAGMNRVAEVIVKSLDLGDHLSDVLEACCQATDADAALLYNLNRTSKRLELGAGIGLRPRSLSFLAGHPISLGSSHSGFRISQEDAISVPDLTKEIVVYKRVVTWDKLVSAAYAPLRDPGGISGILMVCSRTPRRFNEPDVRLLTALGSQVGMALHNARLHAEVKAQARTDSLTGLFNRRYFLDLGRREYLRAQRSRSTMTVLMIDLDGFKKVNDSYGHPMGDRVLYAVAKRLVTGLRITDLLGRYGGDEFAAILPDCQEAQARNISTRLQELIRDTAFRVGGRSFHISASIGLAHSCLSKDETLESLIACADADLYRLKALRKIQI